MDTDGKRDGLATARFGRRSFLTMAAAAGAAAFLASHGAAVAEAIAGSGKKVLWLRGAGCGGCTASLLNGGDPDVLTALQSAGAELAYHEELMAQQGIFFDGSPANTDQYNANLRRDVVIAEGNFVLVVEGAIPNGPDGSGLYCSTGGVTLKDLFASAAPKADAILAAGTCAAFGGVSAAARSVTDARGLGFAGSSRFKGIMSELGLKKDFVNVPGCPAHPDWLLLTLADLISGRPIETDDYRRPTAFFGEPVHTSCPRRGYYDTGARDDAFAGGRCLYNVGCKGPLGFADCAARRWNGGTSLCPMAGGPCIACTEPGFPDAFSPFFARLESREIFSGLDVDTGAKVILGAAVLGAGVHAVKRLAIGEHGRDEEPGHEKEKGKRGL